MGGVHQSKQLTRRSATTTRSSTPDEANPQIPSEQENIHRSNPTYFYRDDIDYNSGIIDAQLQTYAQEQNQVGNISQSLIIDISGIGPKDSVV